MSRHIWNMRKSDTNDNLVTFGPLQHIRLKIKREKRAFLIFSKVFSFLFFFFFSRSFYARKNCSVFGSALIITGKVLWEASDADSSPPTAFLGEGEEEEGVCGVLIPS